MNPLKLAMIGARGHYNIVLRELPELPQVELVGLCTGGDTTAPLKDWCAKNDRQPAEFSDHVEMLDRVRPDIVVVCGPFERRARMSLDAIGRGIHVYTEKTAAITLEDLNRLRNACAEKPHVRLVAMMQYRYDAGFFTAWKLIRAGAIGDVRLINARKSYRLGQRPPFYHDRATYGGTIPWVGSHAIDWIEWMAAAPFETVSAFHSSDFNNGNGSMERSAACLFTLAGNRAATVSIDVFRPENAPSHGDDWIRVVGSEGTLEATARAVKLINRDNDGSAPVAVSVEHKPFADFVNYAAGGTPLIDTRATLDVTEACLLARQAADENRIVAFD